MNSSKFFLGGIVGGIVYFFLGYLFYGLLLKSFFDANATPTDMGKMIWWALIVGNLLMGFLLSYIIGKANAASMGSGAGIGFVVGLLMGFSFDLMMYSMGNGMSNLKAIGVDAITAAVISAIAGAAIGWVYGMGKKSAA
jgi:hypothetical protein